MGEQMNTSEYQAGDRIYYTGDQANGDDFGIITRRREANNYAPISYDIHLDDGRDWPMVYHIAFSAGGGRRFWLRSEWEADRQIRIEAAKAQWVKAGLI